MKIYYENEEIDEHPERKFRSGSFFLLKIKGLNFSFRNSQMQIEPVYQPKFARCEDGTWSIHLWGDKYLTVLIKFPNIFWEIEEFTRLDLEDDE
jgi:hypothetical protein